MNWLKDTLSFSISQLQILQGITINEILEKSTNIVIKDEGDENSSNKKIKTFVKKSVDFNVDNDLLVVEELEYENEEKSEIIIDNTDDNSNYNILLYVLIVLLSSLIYYFTLN